MKLLEENNRQGQAQDLSLLMFYMDGMTRQFEAVSQELQEVRQQLAQAQESPAKKAVGRMVEALGHKVEQAREALDHVALNVTDIEKVFRMAKKKGFVYWMKTFSFFRFGKMG